MRKALTLGARKWRINWHFEASAGVGLGEECHRSLRRLPDSASLPLEVAELYVIFAPFLLSEEGAERVEFGFGWVALASNVHLVVTTVDEVWSDRCG